MSTKTEPAGTPLGNEIDRLKEINRDLMAALREVEKVASRLLARHPEDVEDFVRGDLRAKCAAARDVLAKALGDGS